MTGPARSSPPENMRIEPWPEGEPPLVPPLAGDPCMTRYLPRADEPDRIAFGGESAVRITLREPIA